MQTPAASALTVVFESRYGQTKKIAERVAELASARGHPVRIRSVAEANDADVRAADAVVILAPVYDRQHAGGITAFAKRHHAALRERPTAFFSVSLAAAFKGGLLAKRGAAKLARDFLQETGLAPTTVVTLAGGLNYPAYSPRFRLTMRLACFLLRLPTDVSHNHELTDFAELERATSAFLTAVESRRASA